MWRWLHTAYKEAGEKCIRTKQMCSITCYNKKRELCNTLPPPKAFITKSLYNTPTIFFCRTSVQAPFWHVKLVHNLCMHAPSCVFSTWPHLHMYTVYVCVFMTVCMRWILYMLAALQHPPLGKHGEDFCWGKQELLRKRGNPQFKDWNSDNVAHYEDFKLHAENKENQTIKMVNKQPQWQHRLSPPLPPVKAADLRQCYYWTWDRPATN